MKRSLLSLVLLAAALLVSPASAEPPSLTPDPIEFSEVAGVYRGLFFESTGVRHEASGLLCVAVGPAGGYSARIVFAARAQSFSGSFNPDGTVTKQLRFPRGVLLEIAMTIDPVANQITGTVSDGEFTADLVADRSVRPDPFPTPLAGRYTFLIAPDEVSGEGPSGFGFGVASVRPGGMIFLNGLLADGSRITHVARVSGDGVWAFYVPLYGRRGSILGWINFDDNVDSDFDGLVQWTRPLLKQGRYPAAGWTSQNLMQGSRYSVPHPLSDRVLNFEDGLVIFTSDDPARQIVNEVTLLPRARVVNQSENRLLMNFNLPWGRFVGWVGDQEAGRARHFKGAVLQKANIGGGFFYGDTETGRLDFIAKPPPPPEE